MVLTLRKPQSEKAYQEWKKKNDPCYCPFCNRDLMRKEFKYFIIIENRFSYDALPIDTHYLLASKRHIKSEDEMTLEERAELKSIEWQIMNKQLGFDSILQNSYDKMSIPSHWHKHLLVYKRK